jgi:hypothetical protein
MRILSLVLMFILGFVGSVDAGYRVVLGEGRAAIAGSDIASARKAALAEALYDAAGKLQTKVRGFSLQSASGMFREESSALVEGRFNGYHIVREERQGSAFIVSIEAIGEDDQISCEGKRVDIDVRHIGVRSAPGLQGHIVQSVNEGLSRASSVLGQGVSFRVSDQRWLPKLRGAERFGASDNDYYGQLMGEAPSPAGYSLSGTIFVERERRDNLLANITDVSITMSLKLRDNFSGVHVADIVKRVKFADSRSIFGMDEAFISQPKVNIEPLFDEVRIDLERILACRPLRAMVLEAKSGNLLLSVGQEHGVAAGDYFLVTLPGSKTSGWQIVRIDDVDVNRSSGKSLKPSPVVPGKSLAILMR